MAHTMLSCCAEAGIIEGDGISSFACASRRFEVKLRCENWSAVSRDRMDCVCCVDNNQRASFHPRVKQKVR